MTIRKVKGGYVLVSKTTGRRLSKVTTKTKAMRREKQVRMFKNLAKYKRDHGGRSFLTGKRKRR